MSGNYFGLFGSVDSDTEINENNQTSSQTCQQSTSSITKTNLSYNRSSVLSQNSYSTLASLTTSPALASLSQDYSSQIHSNHLPTHFIHQPNFATKTHLIPSSNQTHVSIHQESNHKKMYQRNHNDRNPQNRPKFNSGQRHNDSHSNDLKRPNNDRLHQGLESSFFKNDLTQISESEVHQSNFDQLDISLVKTSETAEIVEEEENELIQSDDRIKVTDGLQNQKRCVICDEDSFKYKCPSCLLRTCSFECAKQHKQRYRCTGVRNSLRFKRLSQFDDQQLKHDFFFLEECNREIDAMRRHKRNIVQSLSELPNWLKKLRHEAYLRGVYLKFLPAGFSKRRQNKTTYMYGHKEIHWDVELVFRDVLRSERKLTEKKEDQIVDDALKKKGIRIINHRVPEKMPLKQLLEVYVCPKKLSENIKLNRLLKLYQDGSFENICVLMRIGKDDYLQVEVEKTIAEILRGKSVVEYPTLVVLLRSSLFQYKLITEQELENKVCPDKPFHHQFKKHSSKNQNAAIEKLEEELIGPLVAEQHDSQHDAQVVVEEEEGEEEKEDNQLCKPVHHYSDEGSDYSEGEIQDQDSDDGPLEVPFVSVMESN